MRKLWKKCENFSKGPDLPSSSKTHKANHRNFISRIGLFDEWARVNKRKFDKTECKKMDFRKAFCGPNLLALWVLEVDLLQKL